MSTCKNKPYDSIHSRNIAVGIAVPNPDRAVGDSFPVCRECANGIIGSPYASHRIVSLGITIPPLELLL